MFCYLHLSLSGVSFFVFIVLYYFHFHHPKKSDHNLLKIEIWQVYIPECTETHYIFQGFNNMTLFNFRHKACKYENFKIAACALHVRVTSKGIRIVFTQLKNEFPPF
jgi:hypothetical protein